VLFSAAFPGRRLHGTSVLGSNFSSVSPASFSDCAFFMSSLEPNLKLEMIHTFFFIYIYFYKILNLLLNL
jgi:hypothetical protein